jgi:hypothetical protein
MNVAADRPNIKVSGSDSADTAEFEKATLVAQDSVCLIEVQQMPYLPDQQVELLHLQAEADALLLQLQAIQQKKQSQEAYLSSQP